MSTEVLQAESSDPTLRSYAHCSAKSTGQLTVLLINLEATMARTVTLAGLELGGLSAPKADGVGGEVVVTEWHLTGPNGTASTEIALNGELLVARVVSGGTEYELPSLEGRPRKIQTGPWQRTQWMAFYRWKWRQPRLLSLNCPHQRQWQECATVRNEKP